jgi:hypothetical protein
VGYHDLIFGVVNVKQRAGMFHNDCALLDNDSNDICRIARHVQKSGARDNPANMAQQLILKRASKSRRQRPSIAGLRAD